MEVVSRHRQLSVSVGKRESEAKTKMKLFAHTAHNLLLLKEKRQDSMLVFMFPTSKSQPVVSERACSHILQMDEAQCCLQTSVAMAMCVQRRSYHVLVSSGRGHPDHDVFTYVALGRVPAHVQGAGGGISNLQVPRKAQRLWTRNTEQEDRN